MARRPGGRRPFALRAALAIAALLAGCGSGRTGDEPVAPAARTIGFLRAVYSGQADNLAAFLDELRRGGYVEGDTLTVLGKDLAEVHADRADAEATVRAWRAQGVDLIVALSTTSAQAAAAAAPDATVLFLVNDPVSGGLLADPRRPEGRLTGATFWVPPDRTLDLARRMLPGVTVFGIVYPPEDPAALAVKDQAVRAAADLGIALVEAVFSGGHDAAEAVATVRRQGAGAVWALNSPTTTRFSQEVQAAALAQSLPLVANTATATALLTLQPDVPNLYRQMARQALRLFGGAAVSEVPVENPGSFVTEINMKVAAALGLSVPEEMVAAAERVVR